MKAQWVGGPLDGAYVTVADDATWVPVLEPQQRRTDGTTGRALIRYTVPVVDGKVIWSQRVEADK